MTLHQYIKPAATAVVVIADCVLAGAWLLHPVLRHTIQFIALLWCSEVTDGSDNRVPLQNLDFELSSFSISPVPPLYWHCLPMGAPSIRVFLGH
jgi:hypothetical protein